MKFTIEADSPCLILVLPLPQRVEPQRAPRRADISEVALESQSSIRKALPFRSEPLRLVASK